MKNNFLLQDYERFIILEALKLKIHKIQLDESYYHEGSKGVDQYTITQINRIIKKLEEV